MIKTKKYIVVKDRVEIYCDFALSLLYYIDKYYLDRETLNNKKDIRNHFIWCFNKVCDEFLEEDIDFTQNKELIDYFFSYYYHQFYTASESQDITFKYFENFWKTIFNINKQNNRNVVNILVEIYMIYDESINNKKNILEIA